MFTGENETIAHMICAPACCARSVPYAGEENILNDVLSYILRRTKMMLAAVALLVTSSITAPAHAAPAGTLHYPDLQNIIPTADMSIVQTATGREFRYTHNVFNGGDGPLEIQPIYNSAAGAYQGFQHIYTHDAAGQWTLVKTTPVAGVFEFHAAHGHFHFPLAAFGLYAVAPDGGVGAPMALSPKNGFCISDSYIFDKSLPHAGAFGNWGPCTDPTSLRGLSVGAVDEYDYRDPGQSIPIDGLPDGIYWFRAVADPDNYLAESHESNNITDVKVVISNNTVQVLQTVYPDSTPPSITMTSPRDGDYVYGTVTLTASTPVTGGSGVQFLLDGRLLGSTIPNAPYATSWDTTTVTDGTHWLAAQTSDSAGRTGTSAVVSVTVTNGAPPPPPGEFTIDRSFSQDGHGLVSTIVSTSSTGEVLLAFVAADGPAYTPQTARVSGSSLTWTLVRRANAQAGTSEIWTATATGQLAGETVTSSLTYANYDQSLTVIAFDGASGVGASAVGGASSGAPQVQFTSTQAGSWTFGVGNDWDTAAGRTLATGQTMQHQWIDTQTGDTFWVQSQAAPVASAGSIVSIADIAPTTDQWNLVAVEVLPAAPSTPDTTPPTVTITDPAAGSTVSGIVPVAATATDDRGVASVQFYLDRLPLGLPVTTPPFMTSWDTRTASPGLHELTASATDAVGNLGSAPLVTVTVDNSAPPPRPIGIDATVYRDSSGTMSTPSFSTSTPGDLLVAFVAYDGPSNAAQTASVSGAGLNWTLVKRSNAQLGTAEIWEARSTGVLSSVTVTSRPGLGTYHGSLTVVAFTNAAGTGVAGATSAPSGAPDISLPGVATGSWVFAVGYDWDHAVARTPVSGQVLVHQRVDTAVGDTFWVQSTAAPSAAPGLVDIHDSTPTNDRWNYAAVEVVAAH